jgi:hypothetical protein
MIQITFNRSDVYIPTVGSGTSIQTLIYSPSLFMVRTQTAQRSIANGDVKKMVGLGIGCVRAKKTTGALFLLMCLWGCKTIHPADDDPARISAANAYICGKIDGHIQADERFLDQNPSSGFYDQRKAKLVQAYVEQVQADRHLRQTAGCKNSYLAQPLPRFPDPRAEDTDYLCNSSVG